MPQGRAAPLNKIPIFDSPRPGYQTRCWKHGAGCESGDGPLGFRQDCRQWLIAALYFLASPLLPDPWLPGQPAPTTTTARFCSWSCPLSALFFRIWTPDWARTDARPGNKEPSLMAARRSGVVGRLILDSEGSQPTGQFRRNSPVEVDPKLPVPGSAANFEERIAPLSGSWRATGWSRKDGRECGESGQRGVVRLFNQHGVVQPASGALV